MISQDEDLLAMFWQFTLLSLLAVGGLNSVIPDMQRYVVEGSGWLTARQFGEVYALSQATPGPNVMVVTMLGAIVAGVIAPILDRSVLSLAAGQLGFTVTALVFWIAGRSYRMRLDAQNLASPQKTSE